MSLVQLRKSPLPVGTLKLSPSYPSIPSEVCRRSRLIKLFFATCKIFELLELEQIFFQKDYNHEHIFSPQGVITFFLMMTSRQLIVSTSDLSYICSFGQVIFQTIIKIVKKIICPKDQYSRVQLSKDQLSTCQIRENIKRNIWSLKF